MRKLFIFVLLACAALITACDDKDDSSNVRSKNDGTNAIYQKITAEKAKQMMADLNDYILLDVRTEEEFKEMRIRDSILIPDYQIGERAMAELPDKDAVILIYCRSGRRSADAAHELIGMGYTKVYDFGGIIDWPYETVNG